MFSVIVTGVQGRMGRLIAGSILASSDLRLVGATERAGSAAIGLDVGAVVGQGPVGVAISDDLAPLLGSSAPDVVIDFTGPLASLAHAQACADSVVPLVMGTTGFEPEQRRALEALAARVPILWAPNMSIGVNVVMRMAGELAKALGPGFDVEIVEAHHRHKRDAPSGTALKLAQVVAGALGREERVITTGRAGIVEGRSAEEISIQAIRGGDVVGEHTLLFLGEGERVELSHRATSRDQFVRGALRAARWLVGRKTPGLYDMMDALGFDRA